jgi:hypothetical protein
MHTMNANILYTLLNEEILAFWKRSNQIFTQTPPFLEAKAHSEFHNRHATGHLLQPTYKVHIHRHETRNMLINIYGTPERKK